MREIKFRAWIKELNKMIYGVGFLNGLVLDDEGDSYDGFILQYTGLKDRNGVEIYEGDILETEDGWMTQVVFPDDYLWIKSEQDRGKFREVVGNKYENRGLLK